MISKEEFYRNCSEIISQEEMAKINKLRAQETRTIWLIVLLGSLVSALLALFVTFEAISLLVVVLVSVFIVMAVYTSKWAKFKKAYSEQVIHSVLKNYEYTYNRTGHIDGYIFRESPFNRFYDDYHGEDLLKIDIPKDDGTPSGVKLQISDLKLTKEEERYDSKGEKYEKTVTVFEGAFGYVKFPFEFKCNLGINVRADFAKLERVTLEDIEFNKKYHVYTDNQIEALLILTTAFMTKIKDFARKISSFQMFFREDGRFYIVMSRNLFELDTSKKAKGMAVFDNYYQDIADIISIVEEIKNNNKVFKI